MGFKKPVIGRLKFKMADRKIAISQRTRSSAVAERPRVLRVCL